MEQRIYLVTIVLVFIATNLYSTFIGYICGFRKCKKLDDSIIEELKRKYLSN